MEPHLSGAEWGNRFDLDSSCSQPCENITNVEAVTVNGVGDRNENAADSSVVIGERPQMAGEGSMELAKRTGSGAGEVVGTGTGTRTRTRKVMIKTVRLVKKVIKKRVPKRVLVNGVEVRRGAMKVEVGSASSEVRMDANLACNAIESSSFSDAIMEETGKVSEAEDTINTADDFADNVNFLNDVVMVEEKPSIVHDHLKEDDVVMVEEKPSIVHDHLKEDDTRAEANPEIVDTPNVSGPAICDEDDDVSAQIESEMSVNTANLSEQLVPGNDESSLYCTDADNIRGNGAVCEVETNNSKCSSELEVDKANFTQGTTSERENTRMENQIEDFLMQNQRIDIVNEVDMELLTGESAGPIGEESRVLCRKENEMPIVKAESCSGEVESGCTRLNEGLIVSGEMEALERRRKRRTEIFIGGLSKDTREEDIREVFGDVGSVVDVRIVVNPKTRKNRGFAFVQFATAADAKNALVKYPEVKIRGNLCNTAAVEGNDTIFLGNLDRNWKTEDIVNLLEKAGIEKIDKVTLKVDPQNTERNRGFAFVELQTSKDAQTAFKKLQKKGVFGENQMVKVAWADPLNEPAEEEISQVKSVFAEFLPSSWDEEKVKEYFKRFGEIESVALAKDLLSSRRKDFAFINFTTRDAALTCIEAVNRERLDDHCSKVKMAVSLAKPIPERKQMGHTFNPTSRQHFEAKENTLQTSKKVHGSRNMGKAARSSYDHAKVVNRPSTTSTTEELVQLLRQQASTKHNIPSHRGDTGVIMLGHSSPVPGSKRPFTQVGYDPLYAESQGLSRVRMGSSYQFSGESSLRYGVDLLLPPYHHQPGPGNPSESINGRRNYPNPFQTRNGASYYKDTNPYHRY